jgi:integrase/recombinase XerC
VTMELVIQDYEDFLRKKGNQANSIRQTMRAVRLWADPVQSVGNVTNRQLAKFYARRSAKTKADTHRWELAIIQSFWRWIIECGYVTRSPAEGIKPVGRRRKGKPQLRRSEARAFSHKAEELALAGDEGAIAALMALMLGLRSSEVRCRCVRDVDIGPDGVLLWIDEGKTDAAERHLEAPEPLAGFLVRQAGGRKASDWLFPTPSGTPRSPHWLRMSVERVCKAAKVPVVCPHGLRGTWATLTTDAGVSGHVIARELGHTSYAITKRHYTKPGADDRARTRRMLKVVEGGKAGNETS